MPSLVGRGVVVDIVLEDPLKVLEVWVRWAWILTGSDVLENGCCDYVCSKVVYRVVGTIRLRVAVSQAWCLESYIQSTVEQDISHPSGVGLVYV